uniref:WAP four-disulfide core domain 8 n=1 Tax=Monodelphis domestica TaxID=13616 RepID=F6RT53_MONDO
NSDPLSPNSAITPLYHTALSKIFSKKLGTCPQQNITCLYKEANQCNFDLNCKDSMKCCFYNCGKKCIDLFEDICQLLPEVGPCEQFDLRWHYSLKKRSCNPFFFGGCKGNTNNFLSKESCEKVCGNSVKDGYCPFFPFKGFRNCLNNCHNDLECPGKLKCCDFKCGFVCTTPWKVKHWNCPARPLSCPTITLPKCQNDEDCPKDEKCCSNCGLLCTKS